MSAKTYNKAPAVESVVSEGSDVSNPEPFKGWTGWDSFYAELVKTTGCNPKWKEMARKHVESLGWLKDQTKWKDGVSHFGI